MITYVYALDATVAGITLIILGGALLVLNVRVRVLFIKKKGKGKIGKIAEQGRRGIKV
jgi:hypothetical protein